MKSFFVLAVATLLLFSCGKENNESQKEIESGAPVVTAEATEITMNSSILYGYVNKEYLLLGGEIGFIVSTSSTPSFENGQKIVSTEVDKNGKYFVQVKGLTFSTTYYYKAFLDTGTINLVGETKIFTTKEFSFTAIDMGLSVKWANANLGATAPEGYGDYYAWGETETKEDYSWSSYKLSNYSSGTSLTKYNNVDNKTVLELADDVAYVKLGGKWRIPTFSEIDELFSTQNNASYRWEWKSMNGHNGWLVTYLVNNNSIFLPASGYRSDTSLYNGGFLSGCYWSSSLYTDDPYLACGLSFDSDDVRRYYSFRYFGFSVRPVCE